MSRDYSESSEPPDGVIAIVFLALAISLYIIGHYGWKLLSYIWDLVRPGVEYINAVDEIVLTIPVTAEVAFGVIAGVALVFVVDRLINRVKGVFGQ